MPSAARLKAIHGLATSLGSMHSERMRKMTERNDNPDTGMVEDDGSQSDRENDGMGGHGRAAPMDDEPGEDTDTGSNQHMAERDDENHDSSNSSVDDTFGWDDNLDTSVSDSHHGQGSEEMETEEGSADKTTDGGMDKGSHLYNMVDDAYGSWAPEGDEPEGDEPGGGEQGDELPGGEGGDYWTDAPGRGIPKAPVGDASFLGKKKRRM